MWTKRSHACSTALLADGADRSDCQKTELLSPDQGMTQRVIAARVGALAALDQTGAFFA